MTVRKPAKDKMSLKSRGRSPASEAEEVVPGGPGGPGGSNNTSPSHTLAGHARSDTSHLDLSDRGESIWYDEFDSSGLDPVEKQKYLDQFQVKMNKTKEQIKREQLERDSNVDEYLR